MTSHKNIGIDIDLESCLDYNKQPFDLADIEKVLAVFEGEHDGDDWRWIIKVTPECARKNGGRFVFLQGGCDYTGWDCQSSASCQFASTAHKAALISNPGLGYSQDERDDVLKCLLAQLRSGKTQTWSEETAIKLNTASVPKITRKDKSKL